jgi:hypothetical protein
MPKKAEYWSLNEREVRQLREKTLVQGQRVWDVLKPYGFTDWHTDDGWIGCWVERKRRVTTALLGVVLENEEPLRFNINLKEWHKVKTGIDEQILLTESYDSLASLEADLPRVMQAVVALITK